MLYFPHLASTVTTRAPINLVNYRSFVGQSFKFTVTGATNAGVVWGTDIYTDDSSVAAAAVHAGCIENGKTAVITVKILAGQGCYRNTTRNGVTSSSYGAWPGSYLFV